jgi:hypothetical protein
MGLVGHAGLAEATVDQSAESSTAPNRAPVRVEERRIPLRHAVCPAPKNIDAAAAPAPAGLARGGPTESGQREAAWGRTGRGGPAERAPSR